MHFAEKNEGVSRALADDGSVSDKSALVIDAQIEGIAANLNSPHGVEILDTSKSPARGILVKGEAALTSLNAEWMRCENAAARAHLPNGPEEMVKTIMVMLNGVKLTVASDKEFKRRISRLSALFGAGLEIR